MAKKSKTKGQILVRGEVPTYILPIRSFLVGQRRTAAMKTRMTRGTRSSSGSFPNSFILECAVYGWIDGVSKNFAEILMVCSNRETCNTYPYDSIVVEFR